MQWEVVIGLETHTQLSTASKIFSGTSTAFGAEANTQASPVDLALPGVLPVLNRGAVERAIQFGLSINATIAPRSIFARMADTAPVISSTVSPPTRIAISAPPICEGVASPEIR